jgi:hypothetical protein
MQAGVSARYDSSMAVPPRQGSRRSPPSAPERPDAEPLQPDEVDTAAYGDAEAEAVAAEVARGVELAKARERAVESSGGAATQTQRAAGSPAVSVRSGVRAALQADHAERDQADDEEQERQER